ncbi:hypothetical protein MXB_4287 [Myxobolus squamalis]|nr:hypothetical protein MXB_4287 [Myxobolus squamalis]
MFQKNWYGCLVDKYDQFFYLGHQQKPLSEGHLFLNTTFKIVLHPFYQCLVVMEFNPVTCFFIPCLYVLISSKNRIKEYRIAECQKETAFTIIRWLLGLPQKEIKKVLQILFDVKELKSYKWELFFNSLRHSWLVSFLYKM